MKAAAERPRRLAIVASHPVQYQIPWYRALTTLIDVHVLFAHRVYRRRAGSAGFDVEFEWDIPLFEGYSFEWLDNRASRPGVDHFRGCNTPGVAAAIERGRFDAVLVNGWHLLSYWQAIRAAHRAGLPVMVRGDSQLTTARGPLRRFAKQLAYPRMLRSFDACLAVGERNAEYYRHYHVPAAHIYPAPHCVDMTSSRAAAGRAAAVRISARAQTRTTPWCSCLPAAVTSGRLISQSAQPCLGGSRSGPVVGADHQACARRCSNASIAVHSSASRTNAASPRRARQPTS